MGRWNGFGGKVGDGETVEEAARRKYGLIAMELK